MFWIDESDPHGPFLRRFVWIDGIDVLAFVPSEEAQTEFEEGTGVADIDQEMAKMAFIKDRTPEKGYDQILDLREKTEAYLAENEGEYCPACGFRLGVDLHEIIPRSRVRSSYGAQIELFASPILCVKVCRECHPRGNDDNNRRLLEQKIKRYGVAAVIRHIGNVNEYLSEPVTLADFGLDVAEYMNDEEPD